MIFTLTLNPSIDYVVKTNEIIMGATNRSSNEEYYFGGKGINVSCVLSELGFNSTALGFIAGFTGDAIDKGISNEHIRTDFIRLKNGISRINIKIKAMEETEINCQGPQVDDDELDALFKKLDQIEDKDTLIIAGSVPKSVPDDIYEKILERLQTKDIRIVVDASKKLLLNSLKFNPFLIKPNKQELSEIFEVDINTKEDAVKYAKLLQKTGARNVLISLGGDGAMLIDENEKLYEAGIVDQPVINTVGSGDSMVAGFIAGYEKTNSFEYALKLGSACGNATAVLPGLATKEKINELLNLF